MKSSAHIVGAGGIGIAAAACLVRAGWDVTMIESNPAKVAAGRRNEMMLDGRPIHHVHFVHFDQWIPPTEAVVLLCTKTFDNAPILQRIANTETLVPIQNGYDKTLEGFHHPAEAIASFVSECPDDRLSARITRTGSLHIGPRRKASSGERKRINGLASAFTEGKLFPVECVADISPFKSTKLMYNAAISPLAASTGVDNAELLIDPLTQKLFFALLRENYSILRHAGLTLEKIGPFHPDTVIRILRTPFLPKLMGLFFRPSLRGTYCSMSPDMGSGRTEIDAYNGHLVRLAGNFPCPINDAVIDLVDRISRQRLPKARTHLHHLVTSLPDGVLI
ncbi:ketopantoate reductase family protein [Nitrosovibrio sp. Nv4]|uniref:ketopantoate reductase family protein n=1 Tax=Nitrosovibrio sp. Nv4 TaxID=1945880 RepID=UPI000BCDE17C|nr:ketopantoate reductase C-terminal domain-containing protein [Nitrosovibrio sp. Nv4]SOD41424.1 ketopantoate reductase [Nitrosovibrio sp. Nv4]